MKVEQGARRVARGNWSLGIITSCDVTLLSLMMLILITLNASNGTLIQTGLVNMHHLQLAAFATKRLPLELSGAKLPVKLFRLTTEMRAAEVNGGWREAAGFYRVLRGNGIHHQGEGFWSKQQRSSPSFHHHYRCSSLAANVLKGERRNAVVAPTAASRIGTPTEASAILPTQDTRILASDILPALGGGSSKRVFDIVGGIRGGGKGRKIRNKKILLDKVEDVLGGIWSASMIVVVPMMHLVRFCFGLSLLFYGMAFRTFAFHIIVFRLSGFKQVNNSLTQLVSKYCSARQTIREAAAAAEELGEGMVQSSESIKKAREKMIKEKKRLLADGLLTPEETAFFMKKFDKDIKNIMEEQKRFKSARSSILSINTCIDPGQVRASLVSVYNALVASFTASTLESAGRVTLGLHMGSLLKRHVLDMFGPILDPVGYRLDLDTYFEDEHIPYMGKANAMGGRANLILNIICYSVVLSMFSLHPTVGLKLSMIYYGGRLVTDYVVQAWEPFCRRFGKMTISSTPWSAIIQAALTVAGFYFHRGVLSKPGWRRVHPLTVGPGIVGLLEPLVRTIVAFSEFLHRVDFFTVNFVQDATEKVMDTLDQAT